MDKKILNDLGDNENVKSLLFLAALSNVNVLKKNNQFKTKKQIIKDCEIIKKKYIKSSSIKLSNLSKLSITDPHEITNIYDDLKDKINNVDEIIKKVDIIKPDKNNYVECYGNC